MSKIKRFNVVQKEDLLWGDQILQEHEKGHWVKFSVHDFRIANIRYAFEEYLKGYMTEEAVFATIKGKSWTATNNPEEQPTIGKKVGEELQRQTDQSILDDLKQKD